MLDNLPDVLFTARMIFPVYLAAIVEMPTLFAAVLLVCIAYGVAWWLQQKKIGLLRFDIEQERSNSQSILHAQKAEAVREMEEIQKRLDETLAERAVVEERFAMHRDAAHRRETDSLSRIAALEADLATTRETAAQLAPTQARIGDLEQALMAERGRISALEQTLAVTNVRAQEFGQQLQEAQAHFTEEQQKAKSREAELRRQLAEREQELASDQTRLGAVDEELARLKETHATYQGTAETRIAGLQRQLAAAEAKAAMVQKEFMSAVGVLPEPSATPTATNDKRVTELEAKITQIEADARKKAREDGYKIAELEYRLSDAQDIAVKLKEAEAKAAEVEKLREEVKTLMADQQTLMQNLETLKLLKGKSVEPVPEVMEQGFLLMDDDDDLSAK